MASAIVFIYCQYTERQLFWELILYHMDLLNLLICLGVLLFRFHVFFYIGNYVDCK
jgi:hypothetical protein